MGAVAFPEGWPVPLVVERGEKFIRERAILKVDPVVHSKVKKPVKGDAVVKVVIAQDGEVLFATFLKGKSTLKEIAEGAARRWKFEPMLVDNKPARIESTLTFHFTGESK
jgi:hypothetical protein